MPFDELTRFLQDAADSRELYRVAAPVESASEVAALTAFVCGQFREHSPVLLFERLANSPGQVVTNLLGNRQRFLRALGAPSLETVVERLFSGLFPAPVAAERRFTLTSQPPSDRQRCTPRAVRRGLCQQVIKLGKDLDLADLPALHSWPGESAPALTSAVVITTGEQGATVLETIPLAIHGTDQLIAHVRPGQQLARLAEQALQRQKQLPVAIVLGGDPLLPYVGSLPWPAGVDPWLAAGLLRNESLNLLRCRTVELDVPADAEYILEGFIDPVPASGTATLANAAGVLQTRDQLPIISLTALTHRTTPVLPAIVQTHGFYEAAVWSELTERLLGRFLNWTHPQLLDLHFPPDTAGALHVIAQVRACSTSERRSLAHAILAHPHCSEAATLTLLPDDVNPRDPAAVATRSAVALRHAAQNSLPTDSCGPRCMVIDATVWSAPTGQLAIPSQAAQQGLREKLEKSGWSPRETAVSPTTGGRIPDRLDAPSATR